MNWPCQFKHIHHSLYPLFYIPHGFSGTLCSETLTTNCSPHMENSQTHCFPHVPFAFFQQCHGMDVHILPRMNASKIIFFNVTFPMLLHTLYKPPLQCTSYYFAIFVKQKLLNGVKKTKRFQRFACPTAYFLTFQNLKSLHKRLDSWLLLKLERSFTTEK